MQGDYRSAAFAPLVAALAVVLAVAAVAFMLADARLASRRRAHGAHAAPVLRQPRAVWIVTWALPFVAALAFLAVWCARGLYSGDEAGVLGPSLGILLLGLATLPRTRVAELASRLLDDGSDGGVPARIAHTAFVATALLACILTARMAIEVPWNPAVNEMGIWYAAIESVIVGLVLLALYFATGLRGAGMAVGMAAMLLIGVAQHFVLMFKDAALTPADLMALGTAFAVSGAYTYVIDANVAQAVAWACAGIAVAAYVVPFRPVKRGLPVLRSRGFLCATNAIASVVALACFVSIPRYGSDFGVYLNHWDPMASSSKQGFFPCFVKELQALRVPVPPGYTKEAAQEARGLLAAEYDASAGTSRSKAEAQFDRVRPSVVVIMNESFSDVSQFQDIRDAGYAGPAFLRTGLADALVTGDCYVSIYGGGTCNTEFEALTGVNLHYVGAYKYPYTQHDLTNVGCLPRAFSQLGYDTTAMHPNKATNWNRATAYAQMGFDSFLDERDFSSDDLYHRGVSDAATYDRILEILRDDEDPQFVLDVTMQNHSPYTMRNIPAADQVAYNPSDTDGGDGNARLNEYIACINESDRALGHLIGELRELDRPVVVLFFGDHQPNCTEPYNDASHPEDPSVIHAQRLYRTPYFIWANYDVAGTDQTGEVRDEASSAIGGVMCNLIGAPLTDFQKATLASRATMPVLNLVGYRDIDGSWYAFGDEGAPADDAPASLNRTESLMAYVTYLEYGEVVN